MKVTGYLLREALRRHISRRDIADKQFKDSLWRFPDESSDNLTPSQVAREFESADRAVAMLEECQQLYNSKVEVTVQGQKMTLSQAVKRIGGAGRLEKMWRIAASDTGRDRYDSRRAWKNKDEVMAVRQVSAVEALQLADKAARFRGALAAAIAVGNNTSIDLDIDSDLVTL